MSYSEGDVFVECGICYYVEFPLDFFLEVAVGFGFHLGTDKYRIINIGKGCWLKSGGMGKGIGSIKIGGDGVVKRNGGC